MKDTFKYDFKKGDFVIENGNPIIVSGIDALKIRIEKRLHTQINRYSIYNGTGYGANIEDLVIGKSYKFKFTESELKREIETALLKDEDINSITGFTISKKGTVLDIQLILDTVYGQIEEEFKYDS